NLAKVNAYSASVATVVNGYAGTNQIQHISYSGVGGTFRVTFQGQTTPNLPYNISAADMKTALEGLTSIGAGNVGVTSVATGSSTNFQFNVEFQGALRNTNAPLLVGDGTNLGSGIAGSVVESQAGYPGANHKYRLWLPYAGPEPSGSGYVSQLLLRFKNPTTQVTSRVQLSYTSATQNLVGYLQSQLESMA